MAAHYVRLNLAAPGGGTDDKRVKVSVDDSIPGFLEEKIEVGSTKLTVQTIDPGGDEKFTLDVDETQIDHNNLLNYTITEHRVINDANVDLLELWSSNKIQAELDNKVNKVNPIIDNTLIKSVGTSGVDFEVTAVIVDDSNNMTGINDLTIDGDLTVNGTTTSVNSTTLDVVDANIVLNKGGTEASADVQDAGLTIEMSDATDVIIGFDSTLTSKVKVGETGDLREIATTSHTQTLQNKTIDATAATGTNSISMDASDVLYDNASSGLTATEAQAAIDEVEARLGQTLVTSNDTTEGFLDDKLVAGLGIVKTILNASANEQIEYQLGPHYLSLASTGLYSGAVLSVGALMGTFDISSGEGLFADSTTAFPTVDVQGVPIAARTNVAITDILTQTVTYISIDKNDTIIQTSSFPTPSERRDAIFVGVVVHTNNVNVTVVNNLPDVALDISAQVHDIMGGLGFFNISGNVIAPNGTNLSFDKTAGKSFKAGSNFNLNNKDPHTLTLAATVLSSFRYRNQDSSEGLDVTVIDPTTYDNAGVTTTVPSNNNATIQRIYIFPSNDIRVQRGQEVFANFSDAVDAVGKEGFIVETNIEENGLLLASIVTKKNATDLTDSAEAQIFIASRFGELGSVGSSAVGTLQQTYNNSINPEIVIDSTRGALTVRDNAAPIGANLLEVQDNAGTTTFLSVDVNGLSLEMGIAADSILDEDDLVSDSATALATQQSIKAYIDAQDLNSPGDLIEAPFSLAESAAAADVTGLVFANGTVRSFEAIVSVEIDATADLFEEVKLRGIQKGSSWDLTVSAVGDDTQIVFDIDTTGQVTYDSTTYAGFVSGTIRFRATTTSV